MKLLLDTHVFLWSLIDTSKLSELSRSALIKPENEIFVSAATFWEIANKFGLGKLELKGIAPDELPAEARMAGYHITPLDADIAASSHVLSSAIHRDPFDRILAWNAIKSGMTLVSRDPAMEGFEPHGLVRLW